MNFLIKLLASGLGTGFSPLAPGTAGSALAAGFILLTGPWWTTPWILGLTGITFFAGVLITSRAEKFWGHDDGRMVIDEVAGMFLALSFCPITLWRVVTAFFIFRLFDIVKPPPASSAERLPSGWGVMLDDIVAGAYTSFLIWIIDRWISPF
ncbi:MAG TPA: phosphatidylglycerophosphatase A [archaeon]|nr:phosphatidylglycerophosphatase A [archaeon]